MTLKFYTAYAKFYSKSFSHISSSSYFSRWTYLLGLRKTMGRSIKIVSLRAFMSKYYFFSHHTFLYPHIVLGTYAYCISLSLQILGVTWTTGSQTITHDETIFYAGTIAPAIRKIIPCRKMFQIFYIYHE